jgi:hypothetical protein
VKKDIHFPKVEDVAIAIVPDKSDDGQWHVYIVNLKNKPLETVLLVSKGYGEIDGEEVKTSTLRHFFYQIENQNFAKVELLQEKLTGLSNEFWLSFWCDGMLHDKKYVFVGESITSVNLTTIPLLDVKGVMIK